MLINANFVLLTHISGRVKRYMNECMSSSQGKGEEGHKQNNVRCNFNFIDENDPKNVICVKI